VAVGPATSPPPFRRSGRLLARVLAVALVAAIASIAAGCGSSPSTPTDLYTAFPIGPTPWPAGTVGQYGLHIVPSLLSRLPPAVGGVVLKEDAQQEAVEMDDQAASQTLDGYAAAEAGGPDLVDVADWLKLSIVQFKPDYQNGDVYASWIDQYATLACSQANGVASTGQETINNWTVDTAVCAGGPNVYSLSLGNGQYLSMFGLGPKDLGRVLIQYLH
jgi:hypothetical protein